MWKALGGHPIHAAGLQFSAFNEVNGSPYLKEIGARNAKMFPGTEGHYSSRRHWIVTIHDETLEVVGESAAFLTATHAASVVEAIAKHAAWQ